jgi:hypothetical protein
MVSKQFSFRLADEVVEALEALQLEGESLNQTAQRILTKSVGLSTSTSNHLSTSVDIQELVKREVENAICASQQRFAIANSEQLQEFIAKVDERLGELNA